MNRVSSLLICLVLPVFGFSQSLSHDLDLLEKKQVQTMSYYSGQHGNNSQFIKGKSLWQKINPLKYTLGATMYVYQNIISPQLSSGCQYEMVCSNFSKHAIEEYGWLKGIALSSDRLLRCNPANIKELPYIYRNSSGQVIDVPKQYKIH